MHFFSLQCKIICRNVCSLRSLRRCSRKVISKSMKQLTESIKIYLDYSPLVQWSAGKKQMFFFHIIFSLMEQKQIFLNAPVSTTLSDLECRLTLQHMDKHNILSEPRTMNVKVIIISEGPKKN